MRLSSFAILLVSSISLGACSTTWKPPEISYDDTPRRAVLQADPPRPAVGIVADQSDLAEIGIDMCESLLAQHVGDAVGDETLADRIQRDAHSRTPKCYSTRADVNQTIVDEPLRHPARRGVDIE